MKHENDIADVREVAGTKRKKEKKLNEVARNNV